MQPQDEFYNETDTMLNKMSSSGTEKVSPETCRGLFWTLDSPLGGLQKQVKKHMNPESGNRAPAEARVRCGVKGVRNHWGSTPPALEFHTFLATVTSGIKFPVDNI